MATSKHSSKRSAQNLNNSSTNTPIKSVRSKIPKLNSTPNKSEDKSSCEEVKLADIHNLIQIMMQKLDKLELIEGRLKSVESDLKKVKGSIEFAHAEVVDLKEENKIRKIKDEEIRLKIEKLEKENAVLSNSVIDLKLLKQGQCAKILFFIISKKPNEKILQM
jgi:hypothetical protein